MDLAAVEAGDCVAPGSDEAVEVEAARPSCSAEVGTSSEAEQGRTDFSSPWWQLPNGGRGLAGSCMP